MFGPDQLADVLQAYNEYQLTPDTDKDLHANLVLNVAVTNASVLLTLVYLQPVPRPAAYAPFYKLTPAADLTGFYTLHEIMAMFPLPDVQRKSEGGRLVAKDLEELGEGRGRARREGEVVGVAEKWGEIKRRRMRRRERERDGQTFGA